MNENNMNVTNNEEEKKSKRRGLLLLLLLFLLFAGIGGAYTYSRYITTGSGKTEATVAKWNVQIKGNKSGTMTDIVTNQNEILTFSDVENVNVATGKIAPSSEKYADFIIDPNGSEVSVEYFFEVGTLSATQNGSAYNTLPSDLKVSKVCKKNTSGGWEDISPTNGKYKGQILLKAENDTYKPLTTDDKVELRVYVKWDNNDANNATDTAVGKASFSNDITLTIPITATAQQYIPTT